MASGDVIPHDAVDVSSIAPPSKMGKPDVIDHSEIDPASISPAGKGGPAGSVFESGGQKLKRYAKAITPAAAGIGTAGAGAPLGAVIGEAIDPLGGGIPGAMIGSAISGAAVPYAEYGAAKAVGQDPNLPSAMEVAKSIGLNMAFEGMGQMKAASQAARVAVKPEIEALPAELRTGAGIKAAVRSRDFWHKNGVPDSQIDELLRNPDSAEQALKESIERGQRLKDHFQGVVDAKRADFTTRYDAAYKHGDINMLDEPVDVSPIAKQMVALSDQGDRELTPSFAKWLKSKGVELETGGIDPLAGKMSPEDIASLTPAQRKQAEEFFSKAKDSTKLAPKDSFREETAVAPTDEVPTPRSKVQSLRDLKTELRENMPSIRRRSTKRWRRKFSHRPISFTTRR